MTNWPEARHLFDIPDTIAYLNTAYNGPLLREARAQLERAATGKAHPWERSPASFFEPADEVRELSAELFGGSADDYAIVPAASYGIATAARALEDELGPGDVILVAEADFPSNVLAWRRAAGATGAILETVPQPADGNWTAAFRQRLRPQVRVVSLFASHWTNGASVDLAEISRICRSIGSALVLDLTQSLGAVPVDLGELDPDFAAAGGYKWLLWPYGISLLYVSKRRQHCRPLEESWLGREGAENFTALTNYVDSYRPGARRFDVGETCTSLLPGAIASLAQLRSWTIKGISTALDAVNAEIASGLSSLGFEVPPREQRSAHMFGVRIPDHLEGNLVDLLRARDVHVSQRGSSLRISPHLHVTKADVERFIAELKLLAR
ncbi:MAG TPA: aminotransferase class V-fold PLP-dependent enzyme [Sphingomicrobium sp.]|nr:aminotransferase class V-fold PLP-dependent enzyme [Sphingomicrobium sp.]